MKTIKLSQKVLFGLIIAVGLAVIVFLLQQQQDLRQRATSVDHSAQTVCSGSSTVDIAFNYRNTGTEKVNVSVKDLQTGEEVQLGLVGPGLTVSGKIPTGKKSVSAGTLEFNEDGRKIGAAYAALSCDGVRTCEVKQARCTWDATANTTQYNVVVKDGDGKVIKEGTVSHPVTEFVFPAEPGKKYTCDVKAENRCGEGPRGSAEGTCPAPTATPVPTATPTPVPGSCASRGCSTSNPCDAGLICIQARNGQSYCSMPNYQTACSDNPSTSTCCNAPTATPGPSQVLKSPSCTALNVDRSTSGIAPYSLTFTAIGNDPDGVITKAIFNFGDGPAETETVGGGLGTGTINLQKAHTYKNNGTYTATVTFQDNQNNYSGDSCKVTITLGGGGGTPPPGSTATPFVTQPGKPGTPTPTPLKSLPPTGLADDVVTMTIVGSAIALIGSFVVIFLW